MRRALGTALRAWPGCSSLADAARDARLAGAGQRAARRARPAPPRRAAARARARRPAATPATARAARRRRARARARAPRRPGGRRAAHRAHRPATPSSCAARRPADLREGPGLSPARRCPGQRGTTAIAGHRTTYGAPVPPPRRAAPRRRDHAAPALRHASATRSKAGGSSSPDDLSVPAPRRAMIASCSVACHPLFSAARRIVVFARLTEVGQSASRGGPACVSRVAGQPIQPPTPRTA